VRGLVLEESHSGLPALGLAAVETHGFGNSPAQVANAGLVINNQQS
jgi:hypothetical protein